MTRYPYEIGARVRVYPDGDPYEAEVRQYAPNGVWVRLDDGSRQRVALWRLSAAPLVTLPKQGYWHV